MTTAEILDIAFAKLGSLNDGWVGLLGVLLGSWVTVWAQRRNERVARESDAKYLAVLVSSHLFRLARACRLVARDDGTDEEGQPYGDHNGERYLEPATQAPTFDPLSVAGVNWKSIDPGLMTRILELPVELEELERSVRSRLDNDFPYWSDEYFTHRRVLFASMSIGILNTTQELRAKYLGNDQGYTIKIKGELDESVQTWKDANEAEAQWRKRRDERRRRDPL